MKKNRWFLIIWAVLLFPASGFSEVKRFTFRSLERQMRVEVLDDDLVLFEISRIAAGDPGRAIEPTPFVAKRDYQGPKNFHGGEQFRTAGVAFRVVPETLCVQVRGLATICPSVPDDPVHYAGALSIDNGGGPRNVYGLGQEFVKPGEPDGDRVAHGVREPGRWYKNGEPIVSYGNMMEQFNGGAAGNTQIPIMYAIGGSGDDFAIYLDNVYRQRWDFRKDPWRVEMGGDVVRFYLLTGPTLADLRKDYMELVGTPPVPPRKMFGLWVSEYGYENWDEIDGKLSTLRKNRFPLDGFVLDLQWNGGIREGSGETRIGSMIWDETNFPNPETKILEYKAGRIGLMCIEDPLVGSMYYESLSRSGRGDLFARSPRLLGKRENGESDDTGRPWLKNWWGMGWLVDHTNPQTGLFWHDMKRNPLIGQGIMGFWTDLGEPEVYHPDSTYYGGKKHEEIHNLYNFLWSKEIYDGYARNRTRQRPFILSRSGGPGSQRFGVAMWSGDIGARLDNLASQFNAQMHLSLSGIDYYGSDVGGFWRPDPAAQDIHSAEFTELYTQWYASSAWFDVPLRPHTFNMDQGKKYETAPDRVGDPESNLANTRQRYGLIPYYYSLAHRARLYAEPVIAPMVYHFEDDPAVRTMGDQKMVGPFLLVKGVSRAGAVRAGTYLPKGRWFDYAAGSFLESTGTVLNTALYDEAGRFRLPVFARAGAILPAMPVGNEMVDAFGRSASASESELMVKVFPDRLKTEFTLYEDDGETIEYLRGGLRTTKISQKRSDDRIVVRIDAAKGSLRNAPGSRRIVVQVALESGEKVVDVTLDGRPLEEKSWSQPERSRFAVVKSPAELTVGAGHEFKIAVGKS